MGFQNDRYSQELCCGTSDIDDLIIIFRAKCDLFARVSLDGMQKLPLHYIALSETSEYWAKFYFSTDADKRRPPPGDDRQPGSCRTLTFQRLNIVTVSGVHYTLTRYESQTVFHVGVMLIATSFLPATWVTDRLVSTTRGSDIHHITTKIGCLAVCSSNRVYTLAMQL